MPSARETITREGQEGGPGGRQASWGSKRAWEESPGVVGVNGDGENIMEVKFKENKVEVKL